MKKYSIIFLSFCVFSFLIYKNLKTQPEVQNDSFQANTESDHKNKNQKITAQSSEEKKEKTPDRTPSSARQPAVRQKIQKDDEPYQTDYEPLKKQVAKYQLTPADLKKVNELDIFIKPEFQVLFKKDQFLSEKQKKLKKSLSKDEYIIEEYIETLGFKPFRRDPASTDATDFGAQYIGIFESSGRPVVLTGNMQVQYKDREKLPAQEKLSQIQDIRPREDLVVDENLRYLIYEVRNLPENTKICSDLLKDPSSGIENCSFEMIAARPSLN